MDSTFISIILTVLTVAALWGAYELYQIRDQLRARNILYYGVNREVALQHEQRMQADRTSPHLFDQEQP